MLKLLIIIVLISLFYNNNAFSLLKNGSYKNKYNRLSLSMLTPVKGGSVVALVTPMKEGTNAIDYDKFVELLEWHIKEGTDGAVILGTTGEGSMVNIDERTQVIKTAVKTVKGAMPIIIGTGTIETHKVIELTGSKSQILQMPLPQDDPKQRRPNITKAKSVLQWEPKIQIDEGLAKTIEYFRSVI